MWCYLEALVDPGMLACWSAALLSGEFFNGGPLLAPLPRPLFRWPKGGPRPGALPPLEALCYLALELAVATPPSGSFPVVLSRPALVDLVGMETAPSYFLSDLGVLRLEVAGDRWRRRPST